ncbi:MAG: AzlC family ABC transporter permease [Chloroflexota bacterium]|nr:AzlC family ABC transporter permease [Chloroflexota bacterium]
MTKPAPDGEAAVFTWTGARLGMRRMLPLLPSALTGGVVFGVLARNAGMSVAESALMSTFVFAGAAQFVAVGLWTSPLPIAAIILGTFILNLRHVLMGATLRQWLQVIGTRQAHGAITMLTDESWAMTVRYITAGGRDRAFLVGAGLTLLVPWVGGTVVGQFAGSRLPDTARLGLDFAFTAAILAIVIPLWRGRIDLLPWVTAGVISILVGRWLPGTWNVLFGGLAGAIVAGLRHDR